MVEWLAASKVGAALSEGLKSILATGSKEAAARSIKAVAEQSPKRRAPDLFGEKGPVMEAIVPLALEDSERSALIAFFNSDLFSSLLRSSLAVTATPEESSRGKFSELLLQYLSTALPNKPSVVVEHFCRTLSEEILEAAEDTWESVNPLGLTNPGEAVVTSTQSLVAAEIASINAQLAEATRTALDKLHDYEIFERRYRRAVGEQHAKLKPATLHDAKETPINSIYVASHLKAQTQRGRQDEVVDRATLLESSFRTVILVTPGGGKSTFASKLCNDLYVKYAERLYGGRALTPVLVVLKDYAKYRKQQPCSIAEFVTLRCKADMQIEPPEGAIRYLFVTGRAMVIFDGLDELLETTDRIAIKQAVESFVGQYPVVPVLVTSREVGYEQAPLDKDKFEVYRLEPFNDDQVQDYVSKWFSINKTPGLSRDNKAFMRDSAAVPDLRQNPLMLSLLCSLYKQDGHLPSNRPAVYKRCADLLFETWDKGRDIVVNLPLDRKLRPAMAHLAHWIYSDSTLQGGVKETTLITETARYLSSWCADTDEAQGTAEKFISFFRGRAWVFSDTGSSKSEPLYQFTHRTFLEFFTAEHLVKSYGTAREVSNYLLPRLLAREWDVVCQLVYQMYSEMRSASDELVNHLIGDASRQDLVGRLRLASFLARSLDFIFPTRLTRINAIAFCTQAMIEALCITNRGHDGNEMETLSPLESLGGEILQALMSSSTEAIDLHVSQFTERAVNFINSGESAADRANVLVSLELFDATFGSSEGDRPSAQAIAWRGARDLILAATRETQLTLVRSSPQLALCTWWDEKMSISDLVKMHGPVIAFVVLRSPLHGWYRPPIADCAVDTAIEREAELPSIWILNEGRKLPELLLLEPFPWFESLPRPIIEWDWLDRAPKWPSDVNIRELMLLMIAAGALRSRSKGATNPASEASTIIASRNQPSLKDRARQIVTRLAVGAAVEGFMINWIDGAI